MDYQTRPAGRIAYISEVLPHEAQTNVEQQFKNFFFNNCIVKRGQTNRIIESRDRTQF